MTYTLVEVHKNGGIAEYAYTDPQGVYSPTLFAAGDTAFVRVKWQWALHERHNWHVVKVLDNNSIPYTDKDSPTQTINADTTIDVQMDQAAVSRGGVVRSPSLHDRILSTLDYVYNSKGNTPWSVDYDVPVHVLPDNAPVDRQEGGELYLRPCTFDGGGDDYDDITVYHETAHAIMGRIGATLTHTAGAHTWNTE